jgi:lipopolysaccharide assembly outer membrane protein LptD (OstA)
VVRVGRHTAWLAALAAAVGVLSAPGQSAAQTAEQAAPSDSAVYRVSVRGPVKSSIENGERVIYMEDSVRIDHATTTITSLRGKHYPNRRFIVLSDSVRVVDGTAVMLSDRGEYYGETSTVILEGRVRVTDQGWRVRCKRARYNRETRVAFLTGAVSLADSTRTLLADTIRYDRKRETADASGRVLLIDEVEDYSIAGKHARYDRLRKEAVMDVKPILTFDLGAREKGIVTSGLMRFDVDRKIGIAEDSVQMVKGETRASCDSAVIYDAEGRAELYGNPKATNGASSMSGKRIQLWYNEDEVERVVLPEAGRLMESPKPGSPWREDSWIEGDSISIHLSKEAVDSVRILRRAKAMYYPVEREERKVSNDYSTGDNMFFTFKNGELSRIRIAGSSTGLYQYVNLAPRETIDSLAAAIDTTLRFKSFTRSNERVEYSADTIEYFADTENVRLRGNSKLTYQDSGLEAERIDFNSTLNLLEATGDPVLEEAGQRMYGVDMGYDLGSEAGVVVDGSTKYGDGYYEGQDIFKVGKDILKVYNSTYTTCDLASPHYSFRARKMKVYIDDKIVSGPIFLYVGKMPVFFLPYMVNSLRRHRSSGFLRPNFDIGIDSRDGRFLRGFGYYWAINDYTDVQVLTDFNEKRNLRFHVMNKYKLRYVLDGGASFDYVRDIGLKTNEWRVESTHSQTFSPTASFSSNLDFVSSDNAQRAIDKSEDLLRYVDRRIYSTARFGKSWGGTSLSLSASRDQKLNIKLPTETRISSTMPSFSLNFPRRSLWFGDTHPKGERGIWERALGGVMFTPRFAATRKSQESEVLKYSTFSTGYSAGFGQQRNIGFIGIQPSIRMGWDYFRVLTYRLSEAYAETVAVRPTRPVNRSDFSMGFSSAVSTKFYGTFYPRIGSLIGIRHTIVPSLSYNFTPKLNAKQREAQSVSWSLDNSIDLKVKRGAQEAKENGVLMWALGGSYNPELPAETAFSSISSSMRLRLGSFISFNLNNTYAPHERRMVSTNFSTGFNLGGALLYPATWSAPQRERIAAAVGEDKTGKGGEAGAQAGPAPAPSAGRWTFRMNYNISQFVSEYAGKESKSVDSNVDFTGSIQLSKGWAVSYQGYYDIEQHNFTSQWYSIDRDLHCWRASFKHRRFGDEWSYYFEIGVKSLPEIKYQRGSEALQSYFGSSFTSGAF